MACLVLAILLLLESFGPWLFRPPVAGAVTAALIELVAPAAYLFGLWRLAGSLAAYAREGRFQAFSADGLKSVGLALLFGGIFQTAVAPGLTTLAGHGPGYILGLDASAIVISAIGAALWAISRLFGKAARQESELDGIL